MSPVHVVQLDLHEIPVVFVVVVDEPVEDLHVSVIGEAQVTDASLLLLFYQPVQDAIVHKPLVEFLLCIAATADGMQQQIVDIFHLQFLQRILKHLNTGGSRPGLG